uniref:Uncharacterized protein n=1 Tax=Knipowitschia caucasica TaxID=637954 RepID=A0AAV2K3G5_KNICA
MAERTRSKASQEPASIDEKLDPIKEALASMLNPALEAQRVFIEKQFSKLDSKIEHFRAEVAKNTAEIKRLKADQKGTSSRITKVEDNFHNSWSALEMSIFELEDRSRRDNIRIINLPENVESGDVRTYLLTSLKKWLPALSGDNIEVMRAHRIGPERVTSGGPRTVICKMLRYTDRDRILKAARATRIEVNGREVRFAADYSNYTVKKRRVFAPAMDTARKCGFTPFLIYPAKLKLTRGAEAYIFNSHVDAEFFLEPNAKGHAQGEKDDEQPADAGTE